VSGAAALAQDRYWAIYLSPPPDLTRYQPGRIVLELGCGLGAQLTALREAGCQAIGLDLAPEAVRASRAIGHPVIIAEAESLPFRGESCHGLLCKVVLHSTDERLVITEIAPGLAKGGVAVVYLQGIGYSLRYLLKPEVWKLSIYAARTILDTMVYRLTGRRLPGFLGDRIFQSDRRLRRYYRSSGLTLESAIQSKRFLGQPVFIGHVVRK
jgi:SAM-dependent methyltransferase